MENGIVVRGSMMALPLGSSINQECRIDSIAQSWSVLSGRGNVERSHIALESAYKHLVRKESPDHSTPGPSF